MGFIPENTCRRCGSKYSGLRTRCPRCGAPRTNQPTRVPPTTASATPNTAASQRSAMNIRWQFVFGAILLIAVILAVVVLVVTGGNGSRKEPGTPASQTSSSGNNPTSVYTAADLPSPSPSPVPTPEASPTPPIESMAIAFLNKTTGSSITISQEGALKFDLDLNVYPATDAPVTWASTNEKILTVDDRGIVTIVGASPNNMVHAVITAECCGLMTYVTVYVPAIQSAYLTTNLYDPATYDADNAEWDAIIYASPSPAA